MGDGSNVYGRPYGRAVEPPPPIELRCAVDGVGLLSRSWEELRRADPGDTTENQHLQRGELLMTESDTPTVVLVHGGFVDGSGWQGVYDQLKKDVLLVLDELRRPFDLRRSQRGERMAVNRRGPGRRGIRDQ